MKCSSISELRYCQRATGYQLFHSKYEYAGSHIFLCSLTQWETTEELHGITASLESTTIGKDYVSSDVKYHDPIY